MFMKHMDNELVKNTSACGQVLHYCICKPGCTSLYVEVGFWTTKLIACKTDLVEYLGLSKLQIPDLIIVLFDYCAIC